MARDPAVITIGAGMAGLAASRELGRAGVAVCVLEARDRIGGRVFTKHDPACGVPVELGAEFIHGRPPEIWEAVEKSGASLSEVEGDSWCVTDGKLAPCEFFAAVDAILGKMDDSLPDESFLQFLKRAFPEAKPGKQQDTKQRATSYISGFNAADPSLVGVHWLVQGMRAEEKIEGDRAFRLENGYTDLLGFFQQEISRYQVEVRPGT